MCSASLVVAGTAASSALGMGQLVRPRKPRKPPSYLLTSTSALYRYSIASYRSPVKIISHSEDK
jgi:hypothetical protein